MFGAYCPSHYQRRRCGKLRCGATHLISAKTPVNHKASMWFVRVSLNICSGFSFSNLLSLLVQSVIGHIYSNRLLIIHARWSMKQCVVLIISLMLLSWCSPWWTAAPINLRPLQKLMQPEHSWILPHPLLVHFLFKMIPVFSFVLLCPAALSQFLLKQLKMGPVKSRTAVIKEAFGIYECRGFALWMMSSRLQLPVRVVKVKQIIPLNVISGMSLFLV